MTNPEYFETWGEIGHALGVSDRTAPKRVKELGIRVTRIGGRVYALKAEVREKFQRALHGESKQASA